jgi:hypothetical protein
VAAETKAADDDPNSRSIGNIILVDGHSSINSSVAAVVEGEYQHQQRKKKAEPPRRRSVARTGSSIAREVGITREQLQQLKNAGLQISFRTQSP